MPKIKSSPRFIKAYLKLHPAIREKVDKALKLLAENPRHPSLQTKPVQSFKRIYEARVDIQYRLTYERIPDDTLLIRVVALHDDALKNP